MKVKKSKPTKRIVVIIASALLIFGLGFIGYFSYSFFNSLPYDKAAYQTAAASQDYSVVERSNVIEIVAKSKTSSKNVGLIMYPGAFASPQGYVPVLARLAHSGVNVFIVKEPLNFALLSSNGANGIIRSHPEITDWYLAGHSLGGVAACEYAKTSSAKLKGLIMLASFCSGSGAQLGLPVISISATNDGLTDTKDVANSRDKLPPSTNL